MNKHSFLFLADISGISTVIADAKAHAESYWLPESPPITVLFGEIGQAIADKLDEIDPADQAAIFKMIEEGISSSDEQLMSAVATGLIEGMAGRASEVGNISSILTQLDTKSKLHAKAWCGC